MLIINKPITEMSLLLRYYHLEKLLKRSYWIIPVHLIQMWDYLLSIYDKSTSVEKGTDWDTEDPYFYYDSLLCLVVNIANL